MPWRLLSTLLIIVILSGPEQVSAQQTSTNGLADTDWPMFQRDARHSGQSSYEGILTRPVIKWMKHMPGQYGEVGTGLSVSANGTIYVQTHNNLSAVNPINGNIIWSLQHNGFSRSTPAISQDGTIYFGFDDSFSAITDTGEIIWQQGGLSLNYIFGSSPVIGVDGTIYFGHDGIWAFNPDGSLRWASFPFGYWNHTSPAIGPDNTVYVTGDGQIIAFDPNGNIKQSKVVGNTTEPTIGSDGTIFVGGAGVGGSLRLYALTPTLDEKWYFENNDQPYTGVSTTPAISSDGTIYFGTTNNLSSTYFYALNQNGTLKWRFSVPDRSAYGNGAWITAAPVVDKNGNVYMCSDNGSCYGFTPDGDLLWEFITPISWKRTAPLILADGNILILESNGDLYSLVPSTHTIFLPLLTR